MKYIILIFILSGCSGIPYWGETKYLTEMECRINKGQDCESLPEWGIEYE